MKIVGIGSLAPKGLRKGLSCEHSSEKRGRCWGVHMAPLRQLPHSCAGIGKGTCAYLCAGEALGLPGPAPPPCVAVPETLSAWSQTSASYLSLCFGHCDSSQGRVLVPVSGCMTRSASLSGGPRVQPHCQPRGGPRSSASYHSRAEPPNPAPLQPELFTLHQPPISQEQERNQMKIKQVASFPSGGEWGEGCPLQGTVLTPKGISQPSSLQLAGGMPPPVPPI